MKTVRMQGGLGNQLSILAFARSLAVLSGEKVTLDPGTYGRDANGRVFEVQELVDRIGLFHIRAGTRLDRACSFVLWRLGQIMLRLCPSGLPGYVLEQNPLPARFELTRLARRSG